MKWINILFNLKPKPILFCVHGFGVRRSHEFDEFKLYFEDLAYTVIIPEIYDQTNINDINISDWLSRVETPLKALIQDNKPVCVIGFSMGGVIASYLASKYKIERLVLLAPAFEYITVKAILDTVEGVARNIIKKPELIPSDYPPLPDSFIPSFREIVSLYKDSIKQISCPVILFHGTNDETIPLRSSENAFESIYHLNKRLFILKNVNHRILDDVNYKQDILHIIHEYIQNKLIIIDK